MHPRTFAAYPSTAAASTGGGCLSVFFLSPLAVLVVGALMSFLLLGQTNSTALAVDTISEGQGESTPSVSGISPVFTAEVKAWEADILRWAGAAGLDPNMAATVMQIESCGDPLATSRSGAMGLFQVMPYHFASGENGYQPDTNALRGMDYLRRSLEAAGGEARLAFAGYNGGIGVIGWSESAWSAETVRYAYWGSGIYAEASSGAQESLRLQEWLAAGGASLCRQAAKRLGLSQ
jgi:Transglycosylase SLT domain